MLKIYILIVVVGLVGGVVYAGYYYYRNTQSKIRLFEKIMQNLETWEQPQDQTIETLIEVEKGCNVKLNKVFSKTRKSK